MRAAAANTLHILLRGRASVGLRGLTLTLTLNLTRTLTLVLNPTLTLTLTLKPNPNPSSNPRWACAGWRARRRWSRCRRATTPNP